MGAAPLGRRIEELTGFTPLDDFLRRWTNADKKQAVIEELESQGVLLEALAEEVGDNAD